MTDTEINEAVAVKLGWKHPEHTSKYWHNPKDDDELYDSVLDFCHSIAAAWEIVERHPFIPDGGNKASFQLMRREENEMVPEVKMWEAGWARYDDCMILSAYADTPPMAICKAFLKLS